MLNEVKSRTAGLQPGQKIRLPQSGLAEVISLSEGSALVRGLSGKEVSFLNAHGDEVAFKSEYGRQWTISLNSEVEIVKS